MVVEIGIGIVLIAAGVLSLRALLLVDDSVEGRHRG